MLIDIVIPYQLTHDGCELRYALRGVEKHLTGVGEVFIVGDCPHWLKNVVHIPFEQTRGNIRWKERNIFEKVLVACNDDRLSELFLFMNDDHFLLSDYEVASFPDYWHDTLENSWQLAYGDYKETLGNTMLFYRPGIKNFDSHCPILFVKELITKTPKSPWRTPFGFALKTLAQCGISGEQLYPDLKIKAPSSYDEIKIQITDRKWFSIGDKALNPDMKTILNELYPTPSKYERAI